MLLIPTHKCRVCGALWRVTLERDTAEEETWQLCSSECGKCCDNAFMGEQIIPATAEDVISILSNVSRQRPLPATDDSETTNQRASG